MNLYEKYKTINQPLVNPFTEILGSQGIIEVRISPRTVLGKAIGFAKGKLRDPSTNAVVLIGQDCAAEVAHKCARVLQRNLNGLHQCNANGYKINEDVWVPKDLNSDLDSLSVKRHIPVAFIFLAKNELPEKLLQHPQRLEVKPKQKTKN